MTRARLDPRRRRGRGVSVAVLLGLAATGGSGTGCNADLEVGTTEPPVAPLPDSGASEQDLGRTTASEYRARRKSAVCEHIASCCDAAGIRFFEDYCETNFDAIPMLDPIPDGAAVDPTAANACIAYWVSWTQRCSEPSAPDVETWNRHAHDARWGRDACSRALPGVAGLGERCETLGCAPSADLNETISCDGALDAAGDPAPRVCVVHRYGKQLGEACTPERASATATAVVHCGDGFPDLDRAMPPEAVICDAASWTCVAARNVDPPPTTACTEDASCGRGYACDAGLSGPARCVTRIPLGGSCANVPCSETGWCDESRTCVPRKADGAPCAGRDECIGQCNRKGVCAPMAAFGNAYTCNSGYGG